jgi:hypothetical protein
MCRGRSSHVLTVDQKYINVVYSDCPCAIEAQSHEDVRREKKWIFVSVKSKK